MALTCIRAAIGPYLPLPVRFGYPGIGSMIAAGNNGDPVIGEGKIKRIDPTHCAGFIFYRRSVDLGFKF
jgi:hypothetical protein